MKQLTFFLCTLFVFQYGTSQELNFYKKQVDTLCSPYFFGRGYTKNGHVKTAHYLKYTLKNIGFDVITQNFPIEVNTISDCSNVLVNDSITLQLGTDFIPAPESGTFSGSLKVFNIDSAFLVDQTKLEAFSRETDSFAIIMAPTRLNHLPKKVFQKLQKTSLLILKSPEPLIGGTAKQASPFAIIQVLDAALPDTISYITLDLKNKFYSGKSQNIIASKEYNSSKPTLYFTAHYDHLGGYGKEVYISGANDNASGCAMLMDLSQETVDLHNMYNIVFIFFGGEEVGLIGSQYYVNHPKFSFHPEKDRIINLDLMGAGSQGITIENGVNEHEIVNLFKTANKNLVKQIKLKANRANSDHYPFTEKGLHAVFIFSLGDVGGYHHVLDHKDDLEYDSYKKLYKLIFNAVIEGFNERP